MAEKHPAERDREYRVSDKRVLRYDLSINDQPRRIPVGRVVMFGRSKRNRLPGLEALLDVWVEVETPDGWPGRDYSDRAMMSVEVYSTGQPNDPAHVWLATCLDMDGAAVWHLYRTTT